MSRSIKELFAEAEAAGVRVFMTEDMTAAEIRLTTGHVQAFEARPGKILEVGALLAEGLKIMANTFAPKPACAPRKRFSTEQAARAAAVRAGRLVEPCHHCNGWHLA